MKGPAWQLYITFDAKPRPRRMMQSSGGLSSFI